MKHLFLTLAVVLLAADSYAQPAVASIFKADDFSKQIKKPENLEIAKDQFQGTWEIKVYSPDNKVIDTLRVQLQSYSTKDNLIFFSSADADSEAKVMDPKKVTFFQSGENSTIRLSLDNKKILDFNGVLNDDGKITAMVPDLKGKHVEFKLEAHKVDDEGYGARFVCGNDDARKEGDPPHGRHIGTGPELKELVRVNGCKDWKIAQ